MKKSRKIVFTPLMALHKASLYFQRRFGEKQMIIFLAILIGVVISLLSAGLHWLVGECETISKQLSGGIPKDLSDYKGALIFLVLPFIGLFASFITQKFLGGKGYYRSLSPLILSLNLKKNKLKIYDMFSHMISSGLSVGFGGSAGLEAPSVIMGAAVGTNAGGCFAIDRRKRNVLVGCGAAAAIAAIFNSPVAGVLFAAEVLLPEFSVSALIPMIVSSAISAVMTRYLVGKQDFFYAITNEWRLDAIPYYFACGVFCAVFGGYIIWMTYFIGRKLMHYFPSPW
ncbi:MAG: chloride channel protein, partial [Victivallaceae bacterium]